MPVRLDATMAVAPVAGSLQVLCSSFRDLGGPPEPRTGSTSKGSKEDEFLGRIGRVSLQPLRFKRRVQYGLRRPPSHPNVPLENPILPDGWGLCGLRSPDLALFAPVAKIVQRSPLFKKIAFASFASIAFCTTRSKCF